MNLPFNALKCCLLMAYYGLLHHWEFGLTFKLISFNIVTPIVKYFYYNNQPKHNNSNKDYAFSLFNDLVMSLVCYKIVYPQCVGMAFSWFMPVYLLLPLAMEILQQQLLHPENPYVIKISSNPTDFLLNVLTLFTTGVMSKTMDFEHPVDNTTFPLFVMIILMMDFIFGAIHYLCHAVPFLQKHHQLHHTYKEEELCAVANLCTDLVDGFCMQFPYATCGLLLAWMGHHHYIFLDLSYALMCTHLRFRNNQMNVMYFFEWDALDMLFHQQRISEWHAFHHHDSSKHISVFGYFSDQFYKNILFPSLHINGNSSSSRKPVTKVE